MRKMTAIILAGIMSISTVMIAMADATGTPAVVGEPIEYIGLSDEQQYELNTFLTNFVSNGYYSGSSHYFDIAVTDIEEIVDQCYSYSRFKTNYEFGYKRFSDKKYSSYYEYSLEEFNKTSEYLFGVTFTDEEIKSSYIGESEYGTFYQEFNFYFPAADGEMLSTFAIADMMYIDSNGNHIVDFSVYRVKNIWIDEDVTSYCTLSAETAREYCDYSILTKVAVGRAVVVPTQYHWRDIYHLKAYYDAGI